MKKVLIIGGTSRIAQETARIFAESGARIVVAARDENKLSNVVWDLQTRGADHVFSLTYDAKQISTFHPMISTAIKHLGGLDIVLIAHGLLSARIEDQDNYEKVNELLGVNGTSVIILVTILFNIMSKENHGSIAVISSVAGDRGRAQNYVYGAAKNAVATFLDGLRQRAAQVGVSILTIKPGIVDTPMTEQIHPHIPKAAPSLIGKRIFKAISRGEREIYVPWYWRYISLVLKHLPSRIVSCIKY